MSLRDGPLGDIKVPLRWSATAAVVIAVIIAAALLFSDRRETMKAQAYDTARHAVDAVASPVGGVLSAPVRWTHDGLSYVRGYFTAVSDNRQLRAQLVEGQSWHDKYVAVEMENQRFRALLGVATDPPLPQVFARTVSDARGPFANTRLADVGSDRGVTEGNPVLSEHGVVGRIVGVSAHVSRILLLTDIESHTPIMVVRTNARAILSGDGGPTPVLDYLRSPGPLQEGDRVLTSGDGGVFPRGLPVGTVVKGLDGGWRVALDADASPIDDVQILLFKDFSQLVDESALNSKDLPTARTNAPDINPAAPATPPPALAKPASPQLIAPKTPAPKTAAARVLTPPATPKTTVPKAAAQAVVSPGAAKPAAVKPATAQHAAKIVAKPAVKHPARPAPGGDASIPF